MTIHPPEIHDARQTSLQQLSRNLQTLSSRRECRLTRYALDLTLTETPRLGERLGLALGLLDLLRSLDCWGRLDNLGLCLGQTLVASVPPPLNGV
jgi:hypothetical protein